MSGSLQPNGTGGGGGRGDEDRRRLRRDIGAVSLLFTSLGSIIGSGWLLAASTSSRTAGPAVLIAWVVGSLALIVLALIHGELGGAYPVAGGLSRFPHYAYGSLAGFAFGWMAWLGSVAIAPAEVLAMLTLFSTIVPGLTTSAMVLTPIGVVISVLLMAVFTVVNAVGVRWMSRANTAATWWKLAIPVLTVFVLIAVSFHPANLVARGGFAPFGPAAVLLSLGTGVIFALGGFEQAVQLAGESRNARRNVPIAAIGATALGAVVYILLQVAFILALRPGDLSRGWAFAGFDIQGFAGPFPALALALGLPWLAVLLFSDAFISPGGTALLYTAGSARLAFGLSRNGSIPGVWQRLSLRGVPLVGLLTSFVVGIVLFLPFPSWTAIIGLITSAMVMAYAAAPLALAALRRQQPERPRPYRTPAAELLAPLGFAIANLIVYWTGWNTVWKLDLLVAVGFVVLALTRVTGTGGSRLRLDWRPSLWLWPWLAGLAVLSYVGPAPFGVRGWIPFGPDVLVVAAFSVGIYLLALRVRLTPEQVDTYVGSLTAGGLEAAADEDAPAPGSLPVTAPR